MSIYHVTIELIDPTPSEDLDESGIYMFGVREVSADQARKAVHRRCYHDGWTIPDRPMKVENVGKGDGWEMSVPLCYGKAPDDPR